MFFIIEYVKANSFVHKLDPRSKLLFSFCILGSAIITYSMPFLFLLIVISLILWKLSKIPIKNFKPFFLMIFSIVIIGIITQAVFFTDKPGYDGTKTVIFNLMPFDIPFIGYLPVTVEGIKYGIIFSMKMVAIFIPPLILPFTTHPSEIILMLRKFKFPEWMILLFTMAIRFLPLTIQNLTITINAQKLRKDKLGFSDLLLLLESIIITSLRTAKQMALILDVKSFGYSKNRTSLKSIKFKSNDVFFSFFSFSILIFAMILFSGGFR